MRASDDEFLDKCAIEAMGALIPIIQNRTNEMGLNDQNKAIEAAARESYLLAAAMVKERKRLMDEQKKTKVSEKFGKLPEVE